MNHEKNLQKIKQFLKERLEAAGADGYVLGLSGGMDSATAAKTVAETLGPEKITCWTMPAGPTDPENMQDARELADNLGITLREVDISPVLESFEENSPLSDIGKESEGNIMARIRMIYTYMEANKNNRLVLGADNKSEIQLGYFTKYGDGAVDVAPFADLYKTELREFAEFIGLDRKFIEKKPTAGLWEGQTDEEELGETYEVIDKILRHLVEKDLDVVETSEKTGYDLEKVRRFRKIVKNSHHKRHRPYHPSLR